jgi:hypothetical protein
MGKGKRVPFSVGVVVLPFFLLPGCNSVAGFFKNRALDATDIIDLKYGAGRGVGLGAKVEPLPFFGTGLGFRSPGPTTEWFGRRAEQDDLYFAQFVLLGFEGAGRQPDDDVEVNFMTVQLHRFEDGHVHPERLIRVGGEIAIPFVRGGLYLNILELFDFVAGWWFGIDLVGDNDRPREVEVHQPPVAPAP